MEVVDLVEVKEMQRRLLSAACKLYAEAHFVWTPRDSDEPSEIRDGSGNLIAFGWLDNYGRPEFKSWCPETAN